MTEREQNFDKKKHHYSFLEHLSNTSIAKFIIKIGSRVQIVLITLKNTFDEQFLQNIVLTTFTFLYNS